jgi:hypothetical protein
MQRKFLVSYARVSAHSGFGFGDAFIDVTGPMTAERINEIRDYLTSKSPNGFSINILSFQELETVEQTASV